jgi:peroxiredoxin
MNWTTMVAPPVARGYHRWTRGLRALAQCGAACAATAVLAGGSLSAQTNNRDVPVPIRLRVADDVRVGQAAPQVVLPYATRDGIGPAAQPFDLRKELGLVVVLAFYPGDFTPGCAAEWRTLRDRAETLFGPDVVVAGISADSLDSHIRFAQELDLPFKLLSDPKLSVARNFGVADGDRARRAVVVVGRNGVVRYFDPAFAALDPQSYSQLGAAVQAARKER